MSIANKYSIKRKYITVGKSRPGTNLDGNKPSFLVAHETANNSANAESHYQYFNKHIISSSAHAFIDDTTILEIIPLDEKAWHVRYDVTKDNSQFGDDANDKAIGIELCRTGDFKEAYDRYVWYHAYLCKKFGLKPNEDIASHKSLDPTRRTDPHSWLQPNGVTWEQFIKDVKNYYDSWMTKEEDVRVESSKTEVKAVVISNPEKVLKKGDKGSAVTALQKKLMEKGFALPKYGADGEYGSETVAAVKAFQKAVNITVDGVYGPVTSEKLDDYIRPSKIVKKESDSVPYPGKVIKRGSRGENVERIQRIVGVTDDGIYGPKTEAAVKAYQYRQGLKVDGIVGLETWNRMF